MIIDLGHNKIIKDTASESFVRAVTDKLVPALSSRYGVRMLGLQMYEDYIKDNFSHSGFWFYPMTVILPDGYDTVWVKWDISDSQSFRDGVPYSFTGEELNFIMADEVPEEFVSALEGRGRYFEGGCVKLNIHTGAPNPTFLSGKFSQTFVDEMARQLTYAIRRETGVSGLAESSIEFSLVFAPETYMEHTSESVTYRRLLISAKGCSPRDFWVKWRRTDSVSAYSVNDNPASGTVVFELGEDVSHKVREKEYRFLVYGNSDKYRIAMGRKNITEWRDLIKRAVKRGELTKTASEQKNDASIENGGLSEILEKIGIVAEAPSAHNTASAVFSDSDAEFDAAMRIAREAAGVSQISEVSVLSQEMPPKPAPIEINPENPFAALFAQQEAEASAKAEDNERFFSNLGITLDGESLANGEEDSEVEITLESEAEEESEILPEAEESEQTETEEEFEVEITLEPEAEEEPEILPEPEESEQSQPEMEPLPMSAPFVKYSNIYEDDEVSSADTEVSSSSLSDNERLAYQARIEELEREKETLRLENERLAESARAEISLRLEREAELRRQLELEEKERAREKLLFAEAARAAREENERLLKEAEAATARAAAEKAEAEQARLRAEEEARLELERAAEIARIESTMPTAVREDAEQRARELRLRMETEAKQRANLMSGVKEISSANVSVEEPCLAPIPSSVSVSAEKDCIADCEPAVAEQVTDAPFAKPTENVAQSFAPKSEEEPVTAEPTLKASYTYTQKLARLQFCHKVDPNVTATIHRLMAEAIEKNGKSGVYMKVKASVPEENVVLLNFVRYPEEEMELLVAIIKYLGNSELGIVKVILE